MGDKCERQVGDKCKLMRPMKTQSGRQVWETSAGDKRKLMQPKAPRVRDTCGRQGEWETSVEDKWETSVGGNVGDKWGDKCKLMRPKEPRVPDKCGRQVWETSGRQV